MGANAAGIRVSCCCCCLLFCGPESHVHGPSLCPVNQSTGCQITGFKNQLCHPANTNNIERLCNSIIVSM
jgi:hypothetical protein